MTKRSQTPVKIGPRLVGEGHPCFIIAEISCNHEGDINEAKAIIDAAADAGADAVKAQTYTADTMTRNFQNKPIGTMWSDIDLYQLYQKAHTPWEWSHALKEYAEQKGLIFFSSPFDETAVDFLVHKLDVPVLKIASFEAVDTKLLEKAAKTQLPIILSNGMTDFLELQEAVSTLRVHGCKDLMLLHCNSGYPAAFEEANLNTMSAMEEIFETIIGVSDHTLFADPETCEVPLAHITPIEAVRLGAKIVEVHVMLDRKKAKQLFEKQEGGFDWAFSMEPDELKFMVEQIRHFENTGIIEYQTDIENLSAQKTHGHICFEPTKKEIGSRNLRPSLWAVQDIKAGEAFVFGAEQKEKGNFDSIRPAGGLHIRFADFLENCTAKRDIKAGEPLSWDRVDKSQNSTFSDTSTYRNLKSNSGRS